MATDARPLTSSALPVRLAMLVLTLLFNLLIVRSISMGVMLVAFTGLLAGMTLLPLFTVIDAVRAGHLERVLPTWRSPDIGVYAMLPSRHYLDAKTKAWLQWVETRVTPQLITDAAYFSS